MTLKGAVCIIAGGGTGIGRATALRMASRGAHLALVGRTQSKIEAVRGEIVALGAQAEAYPLDVADHEAVHRMAAEVKDQFGKIDVLLNNAGHSSQHRRLLSTTPEEMRRVVDSVLLGTIYCTQAVAPAMIEAGRGTIINVSSLAGVTPGPLGGMVYGTAKAGVINFTDYLNTEFKDTGIRATVVIPGEVDTAALDGRPVVPSPEARAAMVTADEVAEAITLIASFTEHTSVPEFVIRPTRLRDTTKEIERSQ